MGSREDWIVVAGCVRFVSAHFPMMRASDAQPVNEPVKGGRELLFLREQIPKKAAYHS
jgi:hypothetical protein